MNRNTTQPDYSKFLGAWLEPALRAAYRDRCVNLVPFNVHYKPSGGLHIGLEPLNSDWIDSGLRITPDMGHESCKNYLREKLKTVPLYATAD